MRCYNGCPDSKLRAYLDEQTRLRKESEALGVRPTYFPMEEMYMGFNKDHRAVTGFHHSLSSLLHAITTALPSSPPAQSNPEVETHAHESRTVPPYPPSA